LVLCVCSAVSWSQLVGAEIRTGRALDEAQRTVRRRHGAVGADRLDDMPAEAFVGDRVAEHPDVRLLAHARHRKRRERAHVVLVDFPAQGERQEVQRILDRNKG
jgi:hypothetical protein